MRRFLLFSLIVMIIITLTAGCSGGSEPAKTPAPVEEPAQQPEAPSFQQNTDSGTTTNAGREQTSDTTPILLEKYEFNKEYQYDLDGNQEVDTFKVESDGRSYVDLFINHFAYNSVYKDLFAELTLHQYKVVKMNDCNKYALVFFEAVPPNEQEVYFYEFEESQYDRKDQRKHTELNRIGVVTVGFTDLFDSAITYLSHDQVTFGKQTFTFEEGDDTSYSAIPSTDDNEGDDSGYLKIVEIPANGVSRASLTETYHGELIEHSRYAAVVVEDYPYDGNYPFQYAMQYTNPAYIGSDYITKYSFAVMGEIYNVRIVAREYMDAPRKEFKIADKIEDAIVEVVSSFPTDFSGDTIVFDCNGETHQFHVEDMSDDKAVIAVKLPF